MLHQPIHKEMKILSLFIYFIEHRITQKAKFFFPFNETSGPVTTRTVTIMTTMISTITILESTPKDDKTVYYKRVLQLHSNKLFKARFLMTNAMTWAYILVCSSHKAIIWTKYDMRTTFIMVLSLFLELDNPSPNSLSLYGRQQCKRS